MRRRAASTVTVRQPAMKKPASIMASRNTMLPNAQLFSLVPIPTANGRRPQCHATISGVDGPELVYASQMNGQMDNQALVT